MSESEKQARKHKNIGLENLSSYNTKYSNTLTCFTLGVKFMHDENFNWKSKKRPKCVF